MRCNRMVSVALLAACAGPSSVSREGQTFDYRTAKPVAAVAACIKRNADDMGSTAKARLGTSIEGDPEIVVRQAADGTVVAIAQIIADRGTRVNTWILQYTTSAASVANALVSDCL